MRPGGIRSLQAEQPHLPEGACHLDLVDADRHGHHRRLGIGKGDRQSTPDRLSLVLLHSFRLPCLHADPSGQREHRLKGDGALAAGVGARPAPIALSPLTARIGAHLSRQIPTPRRQTGFRQFSVLRCEQNRTAVVSKTGQFVVFKTGRASKTGLLRSPHCWERGMWYCRGNPAEDRALRGRNPSAAWRLPTAEGPGGFYGGYPARFSNALLLEQQNSDKSQGVWGTASPRFASLAGMKKCNWHIAVPLR